MRLMTFFVLLFSSLQALAAAGDLLAITHLRDTDVATAVYTRQHFCTTKENDLPKAYGFKRYRVDYVTTDLNGKEFNTAGLILVPDFNEAMPVLVYQHGTMFGRAELPSSDPERGEGDLIGACMTSYGYIAALPDYLGYGDGSGMHPYLHGDSEAWVARDLLRALHAVLDQLRVKWNNKLFIAGYSQGGHAAMALLKFLENDPGQEFVPTAAAPMAGPYVLSEAMKDVLNEPTPHTAAEIAYALEGLNAVYHFYENLADVFTTDYVSVIQTLFDGQHTWKDAMELLPQEVLKLVRADYLDSVISNPKAPLREALKANDVYEWTPKTPLTLYHGGGDKEVPYSNSVKTYEYMKKTGADVQLVNLGDDVTHQKGAPLAFGLALRWFEGY